MSQNIIYIIVQAGGKGSRLGFLTKNKPKALLPVDNLPMIFHLFKKFPDAQFIVIGDYKYDVLEKYLAAFAAVSYTMVNAGGRKGNCGGIDRALEHLPPDTPFLLVWSDLILADSFTLPTEEGNYIGIARDFHCRWSYSQGELREMPSTTQGVAGLFVFSSKSTLEGLSTEGEFADWLRGQRIAFREIPLWGTKEFGLLEDYQKLPVKRCRPFNRITDDGEYICKEGIDQQGKELAKREIAWYKKLRDCRFPNIPQIHSFSPLRMERIKGKNVYEHSNLSREDKLGVLHSIIDSLRTIHTFEGVASGQTSYEDAYIGKTFARLQKVRKLIPFADDEKIIINGRCCRNAFFHREEIQKIIYAYFPGQFRLLHGDCTFSNIMLRDTDLSPVFIDPRGYFGTTELYGDTAYEWAKLYYSLAGNYDQFNLKRFTLEIDEKRVSLRIASNGWESLENEFFSILEGEAAREQIKLIHSIIWLSLTTYAWEDYDSICGAFYNGLYYLEEVL
jgi:GTP:adenosylcobinamide-phosphate guanylyltransferase/aminoglycoside phosphotransferase